MSANPAPGHFRGSVGYEWISGFTQGDGCFSVCAIRNPKRKLGFNLVCNFKLDQQARSVYLLQAVREAFQGAGSLTYDGKGYWVYIVSSPTEIQEKVVPVFNACGFVGKKGRDYLFLKAVSFCMTKGYHKDLKILYDLILTVSSSNMERRKYKPTAIKEEMTKRLNRFHSMSKQSFQGDVQICSLVPGESFNVTQEFIVGLTDADGSFRISLTADIRQWPLVKASLYFDLGAHTDNVAVLHIIQQRYFGGKGRVLCTKSNNYSFLRFQSLQDILEVVIPFYLQNLLLSSKYNDFEVFATVAYLMKFGKHRTFEGIVEIISLAFSLDQQGSMKQSSRIYSKEQYMKFVNLAPTHEVYCNLKPRLGLLRQQVMKSKYQFNDEL